MPPPPTPPPPPRTPSPGTTPASRDAILTFHSIDDSRSVVSFGADDLERLVATLLEDGVSVVPLEALLAPEPSGRPRVALTFDDGYRNVLTEAAPPLGRLGVPALVYVVSSWVGRTNRWPGQGDGLPELPLLDWDELRAWREAGFGVGAHTATHRRLAGLTEDAWASELAGCRARLEDEVGVPVPHFAYPYGDASAEARRRVGAVFDTGVTTRMAFAGRAEDPLALPRLDAYYLRGAPGRSLFSFSSRLILRARAAARRVGALRRSARGADGRPGT